MTGADQARPGVPIRPDIAALAAYRPGGAAPSADAVKLSSNESPFPPLASVVRAAHEATAGLSLYPDNASTRLAEVVAVRHGVPAERLAFGAGSVGVLMHLLQAVCCPGDEVVFAWRSFEAYPLAATVPGATPVEVPLRADGRHDLTAMAAAVTERTRAVLVCTPNNPTGPVVRHHELTALLDALPGDVMVVVDEAYVDYVTDPEAARGPDLLDDPRVVVLRTFSKAWGLAGYRVGYAIADADLAAAIRTVTPPFAVSIPAQITALAALAEAETVRDQVAELVAERDRVAAALRELGFTVPEAQGNFVWLQLGERTDAITQHFADHGLIVRAFSGEGIRITIANAATNDRVLAAATALAPS